MQQVAMQQAPPMQGQIIGYEPQEDGTFMTLLQSKCSA